jgi:membrane associated rhomboid family serine protease
MARSAPLTTVIIGITVWISVVAFLFDPSGLWAVIGGFVPARFGSAIAIPNALPFWLTPLSAALLHGGIFHLAFNMLMLLWCGRQVEAALGGKLFGLLYLAGAYAAALGQWALDPGSTIPMIGASGAISAVIGMYALVFSEQRVRGIGPISGTVVRAVWLAAAWIGIQALIGFGLSGGIGGGAGVAIGAHMGGFLAGLLLARPLLRLRYRR